MSVLITGAAGFIGSNLVEHLRARWPEERLVSFDSLTYAGRRENLAALDGDPRHTFVQADISDREAVAHTLRAHQVRGIFHLAAESHVDRSIVDPLRFVQTNVVGTATLLLEASNYWGGRDDARFLHVSTDEVFGALGPGDPPFDEHTPYDPHSPYSASKAASDHLARAWMDTFQLPLLLTNCTNNYGPRQFPEKLIPLVITRAIARQPVPIYGAGENVRDWLYVSDHCQALARVFEAGSPGTTYCVGGETEVANLVLVRRLLDALDLARGLEAGTSRELITFVTDRPGHDLRYAMCIDRIRQTLGWSPSVGLDEGLRRTVRWYLDHQDWCERARAGAHQAFEAAWYGPRGGEERGR